MPRGVLSKALREPFGPLRQRARRPSPSGRYAMGELDAKVDKALAEGKRPHHPGTRVGRWILPLGVGKGYVVLAEGYTMTRHGQRLQDLGVWNYDPAKFLRPPGSWRLNTPLR